MQQKIDQVSDFTEIFLKSVHSEDEGWMVADNCRLGEFVIDHVFEKDGSTRVLVLRFHNTVVLQEDVAMAEKVLNAFEYYFEEIESSLLMVYGKLSRRPEHVPDGITVISISEDDQAVVSPESLPISLN